MNKGRAGENKKRGEFELSPLVNVAARPTY